jgi:hypothetical protein
MCHLNDSSEKSHRRFASRLRRVIKSAQQRLPYHLFCNLHHHLLRRLWRFQQCAPNARNRFPSN